MNPTKLLIQRKTRVPTKYQTNRLWRSDWKKVGNIEYSDMSSLFACFGNGGPIETEAQFAKFLYKLFGPGEYMMVAWRKGVSGFFKFYSVTLTPHGFSRKKKNETREDKEIKEAKAEIRRLDRKVKEGQITKQEADQNKEDLAEDIDINKLISQPDSGRPKGIAGYLKPSLPAYGFHSYEDIIQKKKEVAAEDFW